MSENNGFPSMTALLGLLAVAGYQNRDKLAEWFSGAQGQAQPQGAPSGSAPTQPDPGAGGVGGFLGSGLQELIDRFRQGGKSEMADSWVRSGPNQPISGSDLEQTLGPDVLDELERKTGLTRAELVERLSRELPDAVDRYTPDGRIAA
jgi:uncharacterized protein YidB (DUF937 family)